MNWDRIEGNWKQWKGTVKEKWGKLTDDQLDVIAGKREQLRRGALAGQQVTLHQTHRRPGKPPGRFGFSEWGRCSLSSNLTPWPTAGAGAFLPLRGHGEGVADFRRKADGGEVQPALYWHLRADVSSLDHAVIAENHTSCMRPYGAADSTVPVTCQPSPLSATAYSTPVPHMPPQVSAAATSAASSPARS